MSVKYTHTRIGFISCFFPIYTIWASWTQKTKENLHNQNSIAVSVETLVEMATSNLPAYMRAVMSNSLQPCGL